MERQSDTKPTDMSAGDFKLMTQQHQDILTKNIETIASNLCSFQEVLNRLFAEKLVTAVESQELKNLPTRSEKGTQLVHLLIRKDDKAFNVFHDVLVDTDQTALADTIYKGSIEQDTHPARRPVGVTTPQTTSSQSQSQRIRRVLPPTPTFRRQSPGRVGDSGDEADGDELTERFLSSARKFRKRARDGLLSDDNISDVSDFCTKLPMWIHRQGHYSAAVDLFINAGKNIEGCAEHLTPLCASLIRATCKSTEKAVRLRSRSSLPDLRDTGRRGMEFSNLQSENRRSSPDLPASALDTCGSDRDIVSLMRRSRINDREQQQPQSTGFPRTDVKTTDIDTESDDGPDWAAGTP